MFYVPLYIEALRSRPRPVFWVAVLAQAALWVAVPTLFYAAPPGDLAHLLAVAHDPPLRPDVGPPLAYWLADFAFRSAGMFGIYLLAQVCVVAAFWCVFALGRAMVGPTHAVMAVLLMVGIFTFGVPTPEFGPAILAMPFWAATALFYWRAVTGKAPGLLVRLRSCGGLPFDRHGIRTHFRRRADPVHDREPARPRGGADVRGVDRLGRCRRNGVRALRVSRARRLRFEADDRAAAHRGRRRRQHGSLVRARRPASSRARRPDRACCARFRMAAHGLRHPRRRSRGHR